MPELPEVEVVKKSLERFIINSTIKKVKINNYSLRYNVVKRDLNQLIGLKLKRIKRRSKYLLFFFDIKDLVMIVHLGMTGKFFVEKGRLKKKTSFYYRINDEKDIKHNHVIFYFNNKIKLIYNDVRKFGFIKIEFTKKVKNNKHIKLLGPEPLSKEFNFKYFKFFLKGKKRIIKNLLMDQKFVSGLGNIYVNEILFYSNIDPHRNIQKLRDKEIKKIVLKTKKILKKAIILGGSSIKNFSSASGKSGAFQQFFAVYGRDGENCSNSDCKNKIKKTNLSNRSCFYCSRCQK